MNRELRILLVAVVCTPMMMGLILLLVVFWPKMDGWTRRMPVGIRAPLAQALAEHSEIYGDGPKLKRALALDPENALAWHRLCGMFDQSLSHDAQANACTQDVRLNPKDAFSYRNLGELVIESNPCGAEALYAQSVSIDPQAIYLRSDLAEAQLRCGHLAAADVTIRQIIDSEEKDRLPGQAPDIKSNRTSEGHELRSILLSLRGETKGAQLECKIALGTEYECKCKLETESRFECGYKNSVNE